MDLDEEKLILVTELLEQCLLPEFQRDIGDQALHRDDFNVFVYGLNKNLRLVFDILGNHRMSLLRPMQENEAFRANLILLLNEQCGDNNAPFQSLDMDVVHFLRKLDAQCYREVLGDQKVYNRCLEYYKERLTALKWKRNIGAVYGYLRFCDYNKTRLLRYNNDPLLMLSTGMLLVEYFEDEYKRLGLKLLYLLMTNADSKLIREMNIHQVIYDRIMKSLIVTIKNETDTVLLLKCLHKCVETDEGWKDPSKWNKIDDIIDEICRRLSLEQDRNCSSILFLFIAKITTLPIKQQLMIQKATDFTNLTLISNLKTVELNELRQVCENYINLISCRWIKKLKEMILNQKLFGQEAHVQLRAIHICLITCFYGNPLVLEADWITFLNEFIKTIVQALKGHHSVSLNNEAREVLETVSNHLKKSDTNDLTNDFASSIEVLTKALVA